MNARETSRKIDAAAAAWAVRVDGTPLAPEDAAALEAWLDGDVRRLGAFARYRAIAIDVRRAKALGKGFDPDAFALRQDRPGDEPSSEQDVFEQEFEQEESDLSRRHLLKWGAASAAVAATSVMAIGLGWPVASEDYATRVGEMRSVPLAEGSQMTLNTGTSAKVKFSAEERRVDLADGEALFDVAKDPQRPFIVVAGDTQVRAVGTSFIVRHMEDKSIEVLVREGVVEVRQSAISGSPPVRIAANGRALISAAGTVDIQQINDVQVARELAWREGMLAFEDMPLERAAQIFARYSSQRISFADPSIGHETITGLFASNNPAGFARAAALSLDLNTEETVNGVVIRR